MLTELKTKLLANQIQLGEALGRALPSFRGKVGDARLNWLANELQGYPNALDFYKNPSNEFPPYRIVKGSLRVMDQQGNVQSVQHAIGQRTEFFLAAPIAWLEDSAQMPGQITYVELPELNIYMGMLGNAVCEVTKEQIERIILNFKRSFIACIDEVLTKA